MITKFKAKFLNVYLVEIFGSEDMTEPLLQKNLSQKTKFQLKKLGASLQKEYKSVLTEIQELFNTHSEEVQEEELVLEEVGEEVPVRTLPSTPKKRVKEENKEQFLKEALELEEMLVDIEHSEFTEKDFIDRNTGDIVGGSQYYNIIDILLGWDKSE